MTADSFAAAPDSPARPASRCTVAVCRGCCCGSAKVAGVDHAAQVAGLEAALEAGTARLRVTDCLGPCAYGNVIVVQPSPEGRARGGRPVWLGPVNDMAAVADIAAWTRAGGPGIAEPPPVLDLYVFTPPPPKRRRK
ncbi:(2Fe-2S) ferredoxin domain-containing protein [Yinghuangia soli]|uniref:(2Fe-2S) ferredoxin domain-containing protein n=1 Tax=Yinghuangia soli TaxID=2908204 RepID=A0AA41PWJ6_9ACTN|nr:(2Fe-2S) ferredoxin domain-containing protein [Yinghuangia soli]MCF2527043.1 (2Fe-2S) ferredoxin domain-containing protein [Yinghuangia soli]